MRCIGRLDSQSQAEQFGHYLYSLDIENTVEQNSLGTWTLGMKSIVRLITFNKVLLPD